MMKMTTAKAMCGVVMLVAMVLPGIAAAQSSDETVGSALAAKNESVVLRVLDKDGESATVTFDLRELSKALSHMTCYTPTVNPEAAFVTQEVAATEAAALSAMQKGSAKEAAK